MKCAPQAKDSKVIQQPKAGGSLTVEIRLDTETMERRKGGKAFIEIKRQVNFNYGPYPCKSAGGQRRRKRRKRGRVMTWETRRTRDRG